MHKEYTSGNRPKSSEIICGGGDKRVSGSEQKNKGVSKMANLVTLFRPDSELSSSLMVRRRIFGVNRQLRIPDVFLKQGFFKVRINLALEDQRRWSGDIVSVFEGLRMTTIFDTFYTGSGLRIDELGPQSLEEVFKSFKTAGVSEFTVMIDKPYFSPGDHHFGPSQQKIRLIASAGERQMTAILHLDFPKMIKQSETPSASGPERLLHWLLIR